MHRVIKEYENYINELVKIINGQTKRKRIFGTHEFEGNGSYKGKEILFSVVFNYPVASSLFPLLIIRTIPISSLKRKIPFFSFGLSRRERQVSQNVYLDILTGQLFIKGYINRLYQKNFISLLDELVIANNRSEGLESANIERRGSLS
jgi:hypothetical protein